MKRRAFFKRIGGFVAGLLGVKCLGGGESEPELDFDNLETCIDRHNSIGGYYKDCEWKSMSVSISNPDYIERTKNV